MGTFADVADDSVFLDDIEWLKEKGITKGCNPPDNDLFCPKNPVTREQMAAFLRRLTRLVDPELAERDEPTPPVEPPPTDYDAILTPVDTNWQDIVDAAGEGAVIGLQPGIYSRFSVNAWTDQKFIALDHDALDHDVILDGEGMTGHALYGHGVQGVEIDGGILENIIVRNYKTSDYHAAICTLGPGDWYNNPLFGPAGWRVYGVQIVNCDYGITLCDDGATIENVDTTNCGTMGFRVMNGANQVIRDVYANHCGFENKWGDWGHEGGGSKCWRTTGLLVEGVVLDDIAGPGIWTDNMNEDVTLRAIAAVGCSGPGIFHEISGHALIEDCIVSDGIGGDPSLGVWSLGGGGIRIANSQATIRNCTVEDSNTGITFVDQRRTNQVGVDVTGTTEGSVDNCALNDAGASGDANDWDSNKYQLGGLPVTWTALNLTGNSTVN